MKPGLDATNQNWRDGQMSGGTMISHDQKCIGKNRIHLVMFIFAYDLDGVLVTDSVPAGHRVNGAYYSYFWNTIYDQLCAVNV